MQKIESFFKRYARNDVVTYNESLKQISKHNRSRRITKLYSEIKELFDTYLNNCVEKFETLEQFIMKSEFYFFKIRDSNKESKLPKWGKDSKNWKDRLLRAKKQWVDTVFLNLKRGFIRQDTLKVILKKVENNFFTIKNAVTRLVMTEATAIGSFARYNILKALDVKQYQFFTRKDERTCQICGAMHGLIFPMSQYEIGVTASPIHPNCRCFEIPIYTKGERDT